MTWVKILEVLGLLAPPVAILAGLVALCRHLAGGGRPRRRKVRFEGPRPLGLPIEQLAMDLRRLLLEHDRLLASPAEYQRAHRLRAVELALHDRADDTARALGVAFPATDARRRSTAELAALLASLAEAGVVLPTEASLLRDAGR